MPTEIIMPQLGESMSEGTVSKWLVAERDIVEQFDPILEVTTDKIDTEITAAASGSVLSLLVTEGTTVQVGTILGWIGVSGERLPEVVESKTASQGTVPLVSTSQVATSKDAAYKALQFVSPVVSRIATENNVDLSMIKGTGRGGRVTKQDVLKYIAQREVDPSQPVQRTSSESDRIQLDEKQYDYESQITAKARGVKMTRMRQAIAEHMVRSKNASAHVTTVFEVDMTRVVAHREAHKSESARKDVNLTFTAYFVMASAAALKDHPTVNSSLLEDTILLKEQINVGVAVSLGQEGLLVPVIRDAGDKGLLVIAAELNYLASRARQRELKLDEVREGTFTITNHGTSGSLMATPIINQPQCAILGVGAIQKRVMVFDDDVAIRPMVYLTLSFDHRIIDGYVADEFLAKVKEVLEHWE